MDIDDDGQVYIDGELLNEEYVVYHSGVSGHFEVPEGSYFFLGTTGAARWMPGSGKTPISQQRRSTARPTLSLWPLDNFGR